MKSEALRDLIAVEAACVDDARGAIAEAARTGDVDELRALISARDIGRAVVAELERAAELAELRELRERLPAREAELKALTDHGAQVRQATNALWVKLRIDFGPSAPTDPSVFRVYADRYEPIMKGEQECKALDDRAVALNASIMRDLARITALEAQERRK